MMAKNTDTKTTPRCTERSGSNLNRRLQNRQSSQKLRHNTKSQLDELSDHITSLSDENTKLRVENNELKDQNVYLLKKCSYYERTLKSFNQETAENDNDDITIVCNQKDDTYFRVENPRDKQRFVKNFLCLTIFTVLLQIIDIDVQVNDTGFSGSQMRLKSLDIGRVSQNLISRVLGILPSAFFYTKHLLLIVWVVVLVVNYKKIIK